ncbi:MAG: homocysteine S-methyltransferase family protein [Candidatus Ratteibacteria bacterium]
MNKTFENKKFVLLDGAMGTYLEKIGFKGITPEIANIEKPEIVEKIHKEYCESGAEIILTNTFGANRQILKKKGLEDKLEEIIKTGSEIAFKVKEKFGNILIAGDIGPTGQLLHPYGNLKIDQAKNIYEEIGKIFEKTDVDFLILETFQDLEELKIAYDVLKENTKFFIVPCLTFSYGREYRTLMGQKVENYVKWAEDNKISVIGSNCGLSSDQMIGLVKIIRNLTGINLWIKPNAGKPKFKEGKIEYQENIEEFTRNCLKILEMGVKFIGGCCGTTPLYIKSLKNKLNETC